MFKGAQTSRAKPATIPKDENREGRPMIDMRFKEADGRALVRIVGIAFALGIFVATDAASIRSWLLLVIAGCLPPAIMSIMSVRSPHVAGARKRAEAIR
jgi:hypothetical protein